MATVGPDTVRHIAKLAQLELSEDRLQETATELSAILDHMAAIAEFAASHEVADGGPTPRRRTDVPADTSPDHLVQAPTEGTEVQVPQVKDAS